MNSNFIRQLLTLVLLLGTQAWAWSQVLVPSSGSNIVNCGTNVTLCDAGGCSANYPNNANGFTVLRATGTAVITITGTYSTENNFDFVYIYDGIGTGGTLIASFTGVGGTINYTGSPGQSLTVRFVSDGLFTDAGFNLNVTYSGVCGVDAVVPAAGSNSIACGTRTNLVDNGGAGGPYANNSNGFTVLNGGGVAVISINGFYRTEANFDLIRIYDGAGISGTLLGTYSGAGFLNFSSQPGQTITIQFTSDGSFTDAGFDFVVSYSGACICPTFTASANPTSVCPGGSSQLQGSGGATNSYTILPHTYAPVSCAGGTAGPTGDDATLGPINIGFPFEFYGNTYTQLGICTNGNLQLGAGPYNNAFTPVGPIPGTNINNMIALNYADWMATAGGTITYQIQGTAPNRRFVVCYQNLVPFPSGTPGNLTGQIILYEGTNIIEYQIVTSTMGVGAPTVNQQVQGIQSVSGVGVGVTGRNFTNWTASNTAVRFYPGPLYSWTPSTFLNDANIRTPLATNVTATTVYQMSATQGGCSNTANVTVTVLPNPTVTIGGVTSICAGQPTTLTASGGNTYAWSTGANTAAITVNAAGTYTVTATSASGCTATASVNVTSNPAPTPSIAGTLSICSGQSTTLTASGGNTYAWNTGANTSAITVSTSGTYTVTATSAAGCTATATSTVTVNPLPTASISGTTTVCAGQSTTLTASGGSTYAWSTGANTAAITVSPASNTAYTVTVSNGSCSATATATVSVTVVTAPTITGNTTICAGQSTTLTASGGSSYSWNTGATTSSITVGAAGTYTVTATSGGGGGTATVYNQNFNGVHGWTLNVSTGTNAANNNFWVVNDNEGGVAPGGCGVATNGNPTLHITSQIFPTGGAAYNAGGLCPVLFCVTTNMRAESPVFSAAGFSNLVLTFNYISLGQGLTDNASVQYFDGATWTTINPSIKSATCGSGQGLWTTATVNLPASANNNPNIRIAFNWTNNDDGVGSDPSVAIDDVVVTGTTAGTGGCPATASVTVTVNPLPTPSISGTTTICAGQSTTLTASGGNTYAWNTGANTAAINVSPAATTAYTVTATSAAGCTATASSTVTVNPLPTPSISGTTAICAGQSTTLTATGGGTYVWNTGATTAAITVSPASTTVYTVTATSVAGCTATASTTVTVGSNPVANITGTASICNGQSTTLTASGGGTYVWNTGATTAAITVSPTVNTTYTVTVSIGAGCTATGSSTVTVNPLPTPNIIGLTTICAGQSTTLTASGGSSYVWSTGATTAAITVSPASTTAYTVTASSAAGCTATASSTVTVNPLPTPSISGTTTLCAGQGTTLTASGGSAYLWSTGTVTASINVAPAATTTYSVTATSATGCTASTSSTVTVNANPSVTITGNTSICGGQTTTLTAAGGTGYVWNTGATTAALTVSPISTTTYTVTVSNANGCTATASSTVTATSSTSISLTATNLNCNGSNNGTIATAVSGGNGRYSFSWSNGASTQNLNGLGAGIYTLTVTDTLSSGTATTVTAYSENFNATHNWTLNVSTGTNAANNNFWVVNDNEGGVAAGGCGVANNGDATLHITSQIFPNGGAAYNAGGLCPVLFCVTTNMRAESPVFSAAGLQNLVLTFDYISLGEGLTDNASVLYFDGAAWSTINPSIKSATCGSGQGLWTTATVNLPASANNNPNIRIGFNWTNNDDGVGSDPSVAINNVVVRGTSLSGGAVVCSSTASATLTEPSALVLTVDSTRNLRCNGDGSGAIFTSVSGGTPNYTYNWSNGASTQNLSGLAQGSYSLTLTDNNGCSATAGPLALTQPSALSLSVTTVTPAGCGAGANQGTISISNSGGTAPYRYNWSNGATTQNLNGLTVGTYTLTLTDANGCNSSVSASVSSGGIAVSLVSADERVCFGASDGFINIAANPSAGASFSWSTGATTQNLSGLAAGTYTVTASNVSNGVTCTDVLAVTISQPANPLAISVNEVQGLDCSGQAIASAQGTASGGWNTTYTYLWNTGATSSTLGSLGAGSYSLTVTDAEGCVASGNISFTAPLVPQLNAWIGSTGQSSATVSLGSSIALDAGFNQAGVSYQWTPATDLSNANAASTSLTASTEGSATYIVQATAGNCVARDTVTVVVTANFRGIPTAFTPNGDGSNDRFRPIDLDGRFVKSFRVFNRWGQVVYDNAQISDGGWDGTFKGEDQPKDVYLYILEYQLPQDSQPTILRGEVTLVR